MPCLSTLNTCVSLTNLAGSSRPETAFWLGQDSRAVRGTAPDQLLVLTNLDVGGHDFLLPVGLTVQPCLQKVLRVLLTAAISMHARELVHFATLDFDHYGVENAVLAVLMSAVQCNEL